jgi:hypothetical protein
MIASFGKQRKGLSEKKERGEKDITHRSYHRKVKILEGIY